MIIFRYLTKEILFTLGSLTTVLMLVFMSNQFMRYLSRAASGQIPAMFIMKLMLLEVPNLLSMLLPLGFFMAILITYTKLYAESEITVLHASGFSPKQLLRYTYFLAIIVFFIVLVIMLWGSPKIAIERAKLLRTSGLQTLIQTIIPGRFREVQQGRDVFYVEKMNPSHTTAQNVFLARLNDVDGKKQWDVLWAKSAFVENEDETGENFVTFQDGKVYQGVPGLTNYQTARFAQYQTRLPHPNIKVQDDIRTVPTSSLLSAFSTPDLKKMAELQWRFSLPFMVLVLAMFAVPLSRVNPRHGRFGSLIPAIVIFFVYANLLFIARDWLIQNKSPAYLGLWWVHVPIIILGLVMNWRNNRQIQ